MNLFDESVILLLNQFSRKSITFDQIIVGFKEFDLLKGGVISVLLIYVWFAKSDVQNNIRSSLVASILASFVAVTIARIAELVLPFRPRPIMGVDIPFVEPYFMHHIDYDGMSCFPSDHAALYGTLAIGIYLVSRKIGLLAIFYTLIFILLPRIYTGMHHPTDLIGGLIISLIALFIMHSRYVTKHIHTSIFKENSEYSGIFYSIFFLLTFQFSTLFTSARAVISMMIGILKRL